MSPASLVGSNPRKKRNKQAVSNSSILGNHFHVPESFLAILITSPLAVGPEAALLSLKAEGK